MSLQVAQKFGSFISLMLAHRTPKPFKFRLSGQKKTVLRQQESPNLKGFCFPKYWPLLSKATGAVFAAAKKRYALTDKPARELADGITGTEQNGDVRVAYEKALWKSKSDLMGAIVPTRLSMTGMVGSGYITCLACPMGKYNQQGIL